MLLSSLSLMATVAIVSAACTRESLKTTSDAFFKSAFAKAAAPSGLTLSPSVKITQNNQLLGSLGASAYANSTAFVKPWHIDAIDVDICSIATFVVVKQAGETALLSLRLKVAPEDGAVKELEILNALKGAHSLFTPEGIPQQTPAKWLEPLAKPHTRDELVQIVDTYPESMQNGDSKLAKTAKDCPRLENGSKTTDSCGSAMELFKWPVTDRRYVADTKTGVVLASFFFHYKDGTGTMNKMGLRPSNMTTGLWLHEYFKVENGQMILVDAAMQTLDAKYKDIWASQ
jgi:hypothetical protein